MVRPTLGLRTAKDQIRYTYHSFTAEQELNWSSEYLLSAAHELPEHQPSQFPCSQSSRDADARDQ